MLPSSSTVDITGPTNAPRQLEDLSPGLVSALHRCTSLIIEAEARSDPALEPLISRYHAFAQGLSGQIEHVGPGTIASIDILAEDIERVLEGGDIDVKGVDLGKKKRDHKTDVEKMEKKKRGKGCVAM